MAFDISALSGDLILGAGGAAGGALFAALLAAVTGRNAGIGLLAIGVIVGGAALPLGARLMERPPSLKLAPTAAALSGRLRQGEGIGAGADVPGARQPGEGPRDHG